MEVFFPTFFPGDENFFQLPDRGPDRRGQQTEDPGEKTRRPRQKPAHGRTEQAEVEDGPQGQAGGHVQPDPPVPQDQGAGEEEDGGGGPEEQVGQPGEEPGQGCEPKQPEQVVEQPQSQTGGQTHNQGVGLGGGRDGHPRKSRERKETGSSGSS